MYVYVYIYIYMYTHIHTYDICLRNVCVCFEAMLRKLSLSPVELPAEICGDDESAKNMTRTNTKSWLANFPRQRPGGRPELHPAVRPHQGLHRLRGGSRRRLRAAACLEGTKGVPRNGGIIIAIITNNKHIVNSY